MSYVYLLCFGTPIGNLTSKHGFAAHYLGFTSTSLKQRLEQHRSQLPPLNRSAIIVAARDRVVLTRRLELLNVQAAVNPKS
ncbi:excinuclease ABC subunit C [Chroococcidiopsis sp. FACHB-1243]|jgi:hypothetical protein|uniref:excinuclease ABC subunit C n=1 Tax=Chroococcidiopsis sp. [FACHB-1243] TaxID=2692781 RepID=UPI0015E651B2|nr:excinuclease ABC subunit C [Chroococcidiopsis sp. [FACHB-1243]]MBD2305624.1 excinuclease ABC subunit C [Chroococcidiopsis sp. [FACHB-1243]]